MAVRIDERGREIWGTLSNGSGVCFAFAIVFQDAGRIKYTGRKDLGRMCNGSTCNVGSSNAVGE